MKIPKVTYWRGALVGTIIYIALYLLYLFVVMPLAYTGMGDAVYIPMLITGHALIFLSIFIIPHGWMCKETVALCTEWQVTPPPLGGTPWVMEGQAGYCLEQVMTPAAACANASDVLTPLTIVLALWGAYMAVGVGIEYMIKRKQGKKK